MKHRNSLIAMVLATATCVPSFHSLAQQRGTQSRGGAAPAAPAAASNNKASLDNLDDSKLMAELANRGMTNLLDYYFSKNNVPDERRKEIVVLIALQHLDSKDFATKSAADRKKEIDDIVNGINGILPTITDPTRLLRYASALISNGTLRLVNTLEYWGDNPKTQAALNPIAETVDKILEQAAAQSKTQADNLIAKVVQANDPRLDQWQKLDELQKLAEYTRSLAAYGLTLSYDKAAVDKRAEVCKAAIEKLKEFEEIDNVKVNAQLGIAKLSMLMTGDEAYAQAKAYFDKVINAQSDDPKNPNKFIGEQYQARYFSLVADVLAHKPQLAQAGLAGLREWQEKNLPADFKKGADAANAMLEYRILIAKADAAAAAEKEKLNGEAVAVLLDLVGKRPDLRGIIFEQVTGKLPENPKIKELNPLMLEALVTRGIEGVRRKTPEKDDTKNIQRAADAAREIVARRGTSGISSDQVDCSAFFIGVFEEHIGTVPDLKPSEQLQNKHDAIDAYLDYADPKMKFAGNRQWASDALDNALNLLAGLRKSDANDEKTNAEYDRALDLALFEAHRTELAYLYGKRRMELSDWPSAERGFGLVKSDVPVVKIMAKYYQMVSAQQILVKADDAQKQELASKIQKLADELNPMIDGVIGSADAQVKQQYQLTKVRTVLLAADVARAMKSPARVVELLRGFENLLSGFSPEQQNSLLGNALFLRVNALIALNHTDEAIKAVNDLRARQTPEQTLSTITTLLEKLNDSYKSEKGKDNPDETTLTLLSGQRATLSTILMEQVDKDPKMPPNNRRQYQRFDATSQVEAALREKDAAKRSGYINAAIATYDKLLAAVDPNDSEAAKLQHLKALAQFQLGDQANLQKAHDTLNELFVNKKFGSPLIRLNDAGESKMNDMFWEGLLRLLQSQVKLAQLNHDDAQLEDARRILKIWLIQFGDRAGGDPYAKEFKQLRKEILGDWKPDTANPTTQPTTAPVAGK